MSNRGGGGHVGPSRREQEDDSEKRGNGHGCRVPFTFVIAGKLVICERLIESCEAFAA
jgi:hypothetical protein